MSDESRIPKIVDYSAKNIRRTVIVLSLITIAGCTSTPSVLQQSKTLDEYWKNATYTEQDGSKIHDQYVYKAFLIKDIITATTWPDGKKEKLRICLVGDDDFHGKLDKMANLVQQEEGHQWEIKRGVGESDVKYCDVLFISYMYSRRELDGFLNRASGKPILTIGDDKYFFHDGGMVSLREKNNYIVMKVSSGKAAKSGLKFDPELIEAAHQVTGVNQ
ncbi:MAG: YfiR family protein [Proteobacteria bacterium]|nr:YfiR family protein [Pseudomonadota bacterium]